MNGPPSPGQHVMMGSLLRSTSSPRITTDWHGAPLFIVLGGNFANSAIFGSIAIFSIQPSGTLSFIISSIRCAMPSRSSTPNAARIRFMDPNRLIATGMELSVPSARIGFSNKSAGPPSLLFMQRSAISAISFTTLTGWLTRTSSPIRSISATNSATLLRVKLCSPMNCRDSSRELLVLDAAKPCRPYLHGQFYWCRKFQHRCRQVAIRLRVLCDGSPNQRQQPSEVEHVDGTKRPRRRCAELQDNDSRVGFEDA